MQLDRTYIAIRERDMLDLFDLSFLVLRAFWWPLLITFSVGVLPVALFHHWMVGGFDPLALDQDLFYSEAAWRYGVFVQSAYIVVILAPLASAPTTLFLGQAMFMETPDARKIAREYFGSLPQLLLFQLLIRAALIAPIMTSFIVFAIWPYLSEIILLERNPLLRRNNRMSTMRRSGALHGASFGDLFARWLAAAAFGMMLCLLLFTALWFSKFWMSGNFEISRITFLLYLEISMWSTVFYMTIVRFLSYLDLRIRSEGWEVELKMRAERAHLKEQLV